MERCGWCGQDPLYVAYHDEEWGVPERDGRALYEKLVLDGFQAGLAWITILRKRDGFRAAFEGFDPPSIAGWGEADVARLLADPGIVRSRQDRGGDRQRPRLGAVEARAEGFDHVPVAYVGGGRSRRAARTMADIPAKTDFRTMSKALKAEGFRFCGPVIVYAFMQAMGLVNDHLVTMRMPRAGCRAGRAGGLDVAARCAFLRRGGCGRPRSPRRRARA